MVETPLLSLSGDLGSVLVWGTKFPQKAVAKINK